MRPADRTPRELDVIRGIVAGCTNREIARDLALSEQAVKNVLSTVYQKCRVRSRLALAVFSLVHELLPKGGKSMPEDPGHFSVQPLRQTLTTGSITWRRDFPSR